MNYCRITYLPCGDATYSPKGLALLSKNLKNLNDLPFSADEQRAEAVSRAEKMSIQGVQPKLSAVLNVRQECFDIMDSNGTYILKPQNRDFPQLPENESVTMCMASKVGIEVPVTGLVGSKDGSLTFTDTVETTDKIRQTAIFRTYQTCNRNFYTDFACHAHRDRFVFRKLWKISILRF